MAASVGLRALASAALVAACSAPGAAAPSAASGPLVARLPPASRTSVALPGSSATADLVAQFAYDPAVPLDASEDSPEPLPGATLSAVGFASPGDGRASGFIVVPTGTGPFAAVLLMPGSNAAPGSMRPQAVALAQRGAVALVIDQSQTRPGHRPLFTFTAVDRDEIIQTVVDLRRALDLLAARGDVDRGRIAFWGFSHGAFLGGILVGVDRRASTYVLQSGGGADYLLENAPRQIGDATALAAYRAAIESVDATRYLSRSAPASLLLQNGSLDHTYTAAGVAAWVAAAGTPKDVRVYRTDHFLDAQANTDALAFLTAQLGLAAR